MQVSDRTLTFDRTLWVQYAGVDVQDAGAQIAITGRDEDSYLKVLNHFGRVLKLYTFEGGRWEDADTGTAAQPFDDSQAGRLPTGAASPGAASPRAAPAASPVSKRKAAPKPAAKAPRKTAAAKAGTATVPRSGAKATPKTGRKRPPQARGKPTGARPGKPAGKSSRKPVGKGAGKTAARSGSGRRTG